MSLPGDPNSGQFASVGPLGVDVAAGAGFDVLFNGGLNNAFIAVDVAGTFSLHRINLVTGAASPAIGTFPPGFEPVAGIAIAVIPGFQPGVDNVRPSVRITEPQRRRTTTTHRSVPIRGTTYDDSGVALIEVKPGRGQPYRNANETTNWRRSIQLEPGRNAVRARATDDAGNRSVVRRVIIVRQVRPSAATPSPTPAM